MRSLCLLSILLVAPSFLSATDRLPTIAANDNRSRAGKLQNDVLTVYAFGEAGRTLQSPGPLLRVPQGTEIHSIVHNGLAVAASVHGLHERPGNENDAFTLQPGATRELTFKAGVPGTYYYWATTTDSPIARREPIETQLVGAFIIDPPGGVATDRVLVMSPSMPCTSTASNSS